MQLLLQVSSISHHLSSPTTGSHLTPSSLLLQGVVKEQDAVGEEAEEISLEYARRVAEAHGLPVPDPLPKAPARNDSDAASSSSQPTDSAKQKVDVYEGERNEAGEKEGYGTMRFDNGDVYEGEYKADKNDGRGTYRNASGDVYEGEWKGGE